MEIEKFKGKTVVNNKENNQERRAGRTISEVMESFGPDLARIETTLKKHFASHIPFVNQVSGHILFAGGKRLRPLLTVCAARLCEYDSEAVYDLSAVPEYLHAASLLHDDVVDSGEKRRGKEPAYKIWGNPAAVLVGDFLYARAIELATCFEDIRIARAISETVALMAEGEIIQLLHAKNPSFDQETYFKVVDRKTAALISTSCRIGAYLAGGTDEQTEAISDYGRLVGQAFQLVDDVLDYVADSAVLGKEVGTDLAEGKLTLPVVVALDRANPSDRKRLEDLLGREGITKEDLSWVKELLDDTGALDFTREKAEALVDEACKRLEVFPPSDTRENLGILARYVLERKK